MSVVTVIFNPESGSSVGEDDLRAAFEPFADGHRIRWSPTTADDPGPGQAREAVESGSDVVVACGGDGTIRAVAEALAGSGVPLGVVPLGTGNLLAANLGLPDGLDAIPVALSATGRKIDVATVNDERFAVMAGVGFDAMMIRDASSNVKRRLGSAAYVLSAARNLPAQLVRAHVFVDAVRVFSGRTAMVLVGNLGAVTGGLEVFPDADASDGRLDVAILTPDTFRDWVKVLTNLVRGRPQPAELVRRATGTSIEVRLDQAVAWELDGEDRDPTDRLQFAVEPLALEVRCP